MATESRGPLYRSHGGPHFKFIASHHTHAHKRAQPHTHIFSTPTAEMLCRQNQARRCRDVITDPVAGGKMAFLVKKKKPHPNNEYNGVMVQSVLFPVSVIVISCFYKVFKHYKKKKSALIMPFARTFYFLQWGLFSSC